MKDSEGRTLFLVAGVSLKEGDDGRIHCHYKASAIYSFSAELAENWLLDALKKDAPDCDKYDTQVAELTIETIQ